MTVITTISSPEKAAAAKNAGADYCINYKSENVVALVAEITQGRGVDAIAEMNLTANAGLIARLDGPDFQSLVSLVGEPQAAARRVSAINRRGTLGAGQLIPCRFSARRGTWHP